MPPATTARNLPEIEGYIVTDEIARGGMGRVLRAHDLSLNREVAIKVLLPGLPLAEAANRFVRECKITARLPHPGIPPIHQLGTLTDGSPFLAMKLIRGQTLAHMLKARTAPSDNLPLFIQIFEQICQAVGFAHSQGILHRDLKPQNVMVGAFGEVQVMDWGLAKDLADAGPDAHAGATPIPPGIPGPQAAPDEDPDSTLPALGDTPHSIAPTSPGSVLGTVPYMPPEQARGDVDRLTPRSDVFALGGILCHILTGKPPYHGFPLQTLLILAETGDTSRARALIEACGADPELCEICTRCLAKTPADRPPSGQAVAELAAAYRARVEQRLKEAELARASALVRAAEQRKKRKVQLALALALGLLLSSLAAFGWWRERARVEQARLEGERNTIETREQLLRQTQEVQTRDGVKASLALAVELRKRYRFQDAQAALGQAQQLAAGGLTPELVPIVQQAQADLEFIVELDQIRMQRSIYLTRKGGGGEFDTSTAPAQYQQAYSRRSFTFRPDSIDALAARIAASEIRDELVAALDDWAVFEKDVELRNTVLAVARRSAPGPWTDRFRDPAVRDQPLRLWWLAREARPGELPPATLAALAVELEQHGLDPTRVLKRAQTAFPNEFLIALSLALWFGRENRDLNQAIAYYRAARAIRPSDTTAIHNLGTLLAQQDDDEAAREAFQVAIQLNPDSRDSHYNLGCTLSDLGEYEQAMEQFRLTVSLDPQFAPAWNNLGVEHSRRGEHDKALTCYEKAMMLAPQDSDAAFNFGRALTKLGEYERAVDAFSRAIDLAPNSWDAYSELGHTLYALREWERAAEAYQAVIRLNPKHAPAYLNLGNALDKQKDLSGAIRQYRNALKVDPTYAKAWFNLGLMHSKLNELPEAEDAYRRSLEFDPDHIDACYNLGVTLNRQEQHAAAIVQFQALLARAPTHLGGMNNLSHSLFCTGNLDGAISWLEAAVALDPSFESVQENLNFLRRVRRARDASIRATFGITMPDLQPR